MNGNGTPRILIVEDISVDAELAQREIRKSLGESKFQVVQSREAFLHSLRSFQPDLILSDYNMPQFDGLSAIKLALEHAPLTPIIVWTSSVNEDVAVDCIKAGASNYVLKDNMKRLGLAIAQGLKESQSRVEREVAYEMLRMNEERFRALIANNADLIAVVDAEGLFRFASDSILRIMGYVPEEVIGKNILQYIHPLDSSVIKNFFTTKNNVIGLAAQGFVVRCLHKNSSWRYMEMAYTDLLDNPAVKGVVLNMRDVTERKESEQKLSESEANLKRSQQIAHVGHWVWNVQKNIVTWSDEMKRIFGLDPETYHGDVDQVVANSIHPDDRQRITELNEAVIRNGIAVSTEYRVLRADGSIRHVWAEPGDLVKDENGKITQISGIVQDVTEQKEAEEKLLEAHTLLEQRVKERTAEVQDLYENAPAGYHSLDANGVFVRVNQTELNWLGYSRDELIGVKSFLDLITLEGRNIFVDTFKNFKTSGWLHDLELEMIRKDGSVMPVLLNATAIYNENHEFVMSRTTLFDITERKQTEEKTRAANLALARAAKLKDEFLASMSHELRTPLNGILGLSESLEEGVYGPLVPRQLDTLRIIRESGRHLLELINDILDLSKIGAGKLELQFDAIDVESFCQAPLRMIRQTAEQKRLEVFTSVTPGIKIIYADGRRLKQMLVNLLSNAVKFTPEGGRIGLDVSKEGEDAIRFAIWDTGIGIPENINEELFKPFVQLDSSLSRQYSGTGLGLALVRELAELHGGSVGFESTPGKGSRFYFILPIRSVNSMNVHEAFEKTPDLPEQIPPQTSVKILLAEDNEVNMLVTSDYLASKGYIVIKAMNGDEAITRAEEFKPALILMDIQMPGMNGIEVIRRLRSMPGVASVPIIAITALAMPGDRERCLEAGANAYLAKPISMKKLAEIIPTFLKA